MPTEADAYQLLERLRWEHGVGVPALRFCGQALPPDARQRHVTGDGHPFSSQRRVWKCRDCRKQFSVLTGTIFHGTKIPVRAWRMVIFDVCASKNGVAAREIERRDEAQPGGSGRAGIARAAYLRGGVRALLAAKSDDEPVDVKPDAAPQDEGDPMGQPGAPN